MELHGAHGYLIDQFFGETTNKRTDHFGGLIIAERNRFAVEVVKEVHKAAGEAFAVILLSLLISIISTSEHPWKWDIG